MTQENPTWGIHRITGELRKLGFNISDTTVYRYMPVRGSGKPDPGWTTFIRNHMKETAAVDFFVVVTFSFQLLYGMVVMSHGRRKIIHFGVTEHPTQEWAADQMRDAFSRYPKPKYLVRDRDAIFGSAFRKSMQEMSITELRTARHSPKQNVYCERLIGSIRYDLLNHVIVLNARHLRRLLAGYKDYYNYSRTHLALSYDSPIHRQVERPVRGEKIVSLPLLGGLHHRYERRAA
jgi:transposase InsO family protein